MLSLRGPRWRAILSLSLSLPLLGRRSRHRHHPAKAARSLRVEPLEDRLAPAAAPFFTHAPLPPVLPPMLEQGLKMLFQLAQHENFRLMTEDLRKASLGMSSHPLLNRASQTVDLSNHPILAALAASGDGSLWTDLGYELLRTEVSDRSAGLPAVPLAQGVMTTTMILVHNESANSANGLALSAGDFSSLPARLPILTETLSSSPFNFQSPMTPGNDRSIVFELSPYAPAAPDIVPIPVPRGWTTGLPSYSALPRKGQAMRWAPATIRATPFERPCSRCCTKAGCRNGSASFRRSFRNGPAKGLCRCRSSKLLSPNQLRSNPAAYRKPPPGSLRGRFARLGVNRVNCRVSSLWPARCSDCSPPAWAGPSGTRDAGNRKTEPTRTYLRCRRCSYNPLRAIIGEPAE